jgi:hypothetical protein
MGSFIDKSSVVFITKLVRLQIKGQTITPDSCYIIPVKIYIILTLSFKPAGILSNISRCNQPLSGDIGTHYNQRGKKDRVNEFIDCQD